MAFDKLKLLAILAAYPQLKQEVADLTASIATLTVQVETLQARVTELDEYALLLEDPEIVAAYEAAIAVLEP